jgi:hypothetical protein
MEQNVIKTEDSIDTPINDDEVKEIYVGLEESREKKHIFLKIFSRNAYMITTAAKIFCLTIILNGNRILFIQFLGLKNGSEVFNQFTKANQAKIMERRFAIDTFRQNYGKPKYFRITQYS